VTQWPVILRGSPGADDWTPPGTEHRGRSLASQVSLYWHAAADANAEGDRFGMASVLVARGRLVLHGLLVVPENIDPAALDALGRWAKRHPVGTLQGPAPWRVVTRSAFFSPTATRERQPWAFVPNAYNRGAGPMVGADHGRTIALVAEHVTRRSGRNVGSSEAWLPGWGVEHERHRWKRRYPDRPALRLESRRVGWSVRFGPCETGHGTRGAPFADVLSAAYALDADRAAGFVEHARNFDVAADELPVTVTLDAHGAVRMATAVGSVHALALRLDAEVGRWFSRPEDRREWVHRLPLARVQSPAALADHLLRQLRVDAPLRRFPLTDAEPAVWWEAFHGGWIDDVPALRGRPFGAVALDVTSAYPLTAHLVGWWDLVTADHLVRRSVLRALRALCRRAAKDPSVLFDPAVWAMFGCTICEVVPDGEPFPVALDDPHRPDGRTETVPVGARGRALFYSWCDVVAAAVLSGRVPTIVRAVRLVPVGRQDGLRERVPVCPGLTVTSGTDPVLGLVRRRREAKTAGETGAVLAALLHAATNSLVSGNPSRLDDVRRKVGDKWTTEERSGPWTFAPLAVTVTGGARLLLAVLARQVADLGGIVAYRDTDSSIIPASPSGGMLTLADSSTVRELPYADLDRLLAGFDTLSPEPGWPVWKRDPKPGEPPMRSVVFGPKRHVEYRGTDEAPELVDWTETGLGGMWADPSAMPGRCAEGGRAWSKAAVVREVRYAAAKLADPEHARRDPSPWDAPGGLRFPTLRRLEVTSPALLDTLPAALGAGIGSRYVEAVGGTAGTRTEERHVVALDPGGPLDHWQGLGWLDRATGEAVRVATDPMDLGAVLIESLVARAGQYGERPRGEPVESVTVTPLSVRYRGRVSPVLDAQEDGYPGRLDRFRVRYEDSHGLGPGQRDALVALARSLPHADFARLGGATPRVALQLARGELPRAVTVRHLLAELRRNGGAWIVPGDRTCGLDECPQAVTDRRIYCCPSHAETGRKRRQRERGARP